MLPHIVLRSLSSVGSIFPDSWLNYRLQHECPPLPKGDLIYDVYMGYPEIFQWDKKRCVAYVRYVKRTPLPSRYNAPSLTPVEKSFSTDLTVLKSLATSTMLV